MRVGFIYALKDLISRLGPAEGYVISAGQWLELFTVEDSMGPRLGSQQPD